MAEHIKIDDLGVRKRYSVGSAPQTVFTVPFPFFEPADLKVHVGTTLLTLLDYLVEGAGVSSGGKITLYAAVSNTTVTIIRDVPTRRLTDLPASGPLQIDSLNTELDRIIAMIQEGGDEASRAVRLNDLDPGTSMVLPLPDSRAGKYFAFGAMGELVMAAPPTVNVSAAEFNTRLAALGAIIAAGTDFLRTAGYATAGDGGGGLYKRVDAQPSHAGKLQTADGAWWELAQFEVTPEMFGAKRDGTTNDGPAINAAAAYLAAKGGGVLKLLPGTYQTSKRIDLGGNTILRGAGFRASWIKAHPTALQATGGGHVVMAESVNNVLVENISVSGDYGTAADPDRYGMGIVLSKVINGTVRNCYVEKTRGYGIYAGGMFGVPCLKVAIEDNEIVNTLTGITLFKNVQWASLERNRIDICRSHGVLIDDATVPDNPSNTDPALKPASDFNIRVRDNVITNAAAGEWGAGIATSAVVGLDISGNHIGVVGTAAGGEGIIINSGQAFYAPGQDVRICGNVIRDIYRGSSSGRGLIVSGGWRVNVIGNFFFALSQGSSSSGVPVIHLSDDNASSGQHTNGVHIASNYISGNGFSSVGVQIDAGVTNSVVGANTFLSVAVEVANSGGASNKKVALVAA